MPFPRGSLKAAVLPQQWFNASCSFVWLEALGGCINPNTHPNSACSTHTTKIKQSFPRDNASISPAQAFLYVLVCVCAHTHTPPHTSQLGSFTYTQCGKTKTGNEIQASNHCQGDGSVVSAVIVNASINLGENEWNLNELCVNPEWPQRTGRALGHSRHFVTYCF